MSNKIKQINASVSMELIIRNHETAFIEVVTKLSDATYRVVHISGPRFDVEDYFEGTLNMDELQKKWAK